MASRTQTAESLSKSMGEMFDANVKGKYSPVEMISNYCSMFMVFMREIMCNTAIIADYCANHSIPDFPNKEERSRAGDSFKEPDA